VPAAAREAVPVDGLAAAMDLMVVVDGGATLMVVRGTVAPALLINDDGSLDWETVFSFCTDGVGVGEEMTDEKLDEEGSMDAVEAFCDFGISRCGL
jgi:nucleoid-associated protein YejK